MRVVDSTNISWEIISGHRVGSIAFRRLLNGVEGRPDNYEFSLVKQEGAFHSPVHRHNFDQVRVPLTGRTSYAKNLYIHPGEIGYFPEGTYYGPQDIDELTETLVLQCGGVSGDGFLGYQRLHEGYGILKERGRFEDGKFFSNDASTTSEPKDSYEAIWEHMNGRELAYRPQRFRAPVIMDMGAFNWLETSTSVMHKQLAQFSERGIAMALYRLDRSAVTALDASGSTRLIFVLRGAIALDDVDVKENGAAEIENGESARMVGRAEAEAEVLLLTLPRFAQ
jgi:hypothetical protein